jgi:UDP-N-acetylglucosamine 4,6-dehydratase/5-epimerase
LDTMNDLDFLKDKVVLVTGGTGSFGQKFVGRLLGLNVCKKIIIFSRDEFKQHEMRQKISDPESRLRFFLGDVRDLPRLQRAFWGVDFVVHAAALKQVPALEFNPLEAIKTNVLGTQNIIDAALDNKVEKVLFVSTDKSVNPINLYGATKLCAEKLLIAANAYRQTSHLPPYFSVVRYGNVVGSRGSIVEVLKNQKKTGEVTLTHEEMTRFWITLDQGVDLVLDTLDLMRGGEIVVPKLSAMKVKDLISVLASDCKVKIIGVRPGEKLHEMLLTEDEARRAKDIGKYYLVEPNHDWWSKSHFKEFPSVPANFNYASNEVKELTKEDFLNFV